MLTSIIGSGANLLGGVMDVLGENLGTETRKRIFGYTGSPLDRSIGGLSGASSQLNSVMTSDEVEYNNAFGDFAGGMSGALNLVGGALTGLSGTDLFGGEDQGPIKTMFNPNAPPQQQPQQQFAVQKKKSAFDTLSSVREQYSQPVEMQEGGKNESSAEPVEAKGGEYEVHYDDDYNIKSIKRISGPSHERGGVNMMLRKNHAILNQQQFDELEKGKSLKDVLKTIQNVGGMAEEGANNDPNETLAGLYDKYKLSDDGLKSMYTGRLGYNLLSTFVNLLGTPDIKAPTVDLPKPATVTSKAVRLPGAYNTLERTTASAIDAARSSGKTEQLPGIFRESGRIATEIGGKEARETRLAQQKANEFNVQTGNQFLKDKAMLKLQTDKMQMDADREGRHIKNLKDTELFKTMFSTSQLPGQYAQAKEAAMWDKINREVYLKSMISGRTYG